MFVLKTVGAFINLVCVFCNRNTSKLQWSPPVILVFLLNKIWKICLFIRSIRSFNQFSFWACFSFFLFSRSTPSWSDFFRFSMHYSPARLGSFFSKYCLSQGLSLCWRCFVSSIELLHSNLPIFLLVNVKMDWLNFQVHHPENFDNHLWE